ncbi:diacylglycerol/polyprenol kinase family protein [Methanolobus halotolerans]|uniref:Phytol kinase n=1 Tax=Methanolobus halotolerans TaxID=2052935 RepID=A0A4E0Q0H0_9EURY|nr:hypothetical protein CUN85_01270 [Methanolobus halotolerans]
MSDKKYFLKGEIGRQLIHILTGFIFLFIIFLSGSYAALVFTILLVAVIFTSFLFQEFPVPKKAPDIFRRLGRPFKQTVKLQGTILLIFGVLTILLLFPRDIVYASVAIVTFGDSIATIVGVSIGKHNLPYSENKTLEGTLSGIAFALGAALLFVTPLQAFLGSVGGMLVESTIDLHTVRKASLKALSEFFLNDNFLIPVFSSLLMFAVR